MGIATFIFRSLKLSVPVALRMLPIILLSLVAVALFYNLMTSSPVIFFVVMAAAYLPLLVFLFVCAVRAGLMSLRATAPVDLKRLGETTVRVMRFNFMLNNVIVGVIGVGVAVLSVLVLQPGLIRRAREGFELETLSDLEDIFIFAGQFPLFVLPIIGLGACISIAANGSSVAAASASAAARGPNHDLLFGLARQFPQLFCLGLLIVFLPLCLMQFYAGGLRATLADAFALGLPLYVGGPLYLGWAVCAIAAGMSMAYVITLAQNKDDKSTQKDEMMGDKYGSDDIRALRQARQRLIDGDEIQAEPSQEDSQSQPNPLGQDPELPPESPAKL